MVSTVSGIHPEAKIHPQALVDPLAKIAAGVEIGPWSLIGPGVEIGENSVIASHVVIKGPTKMGCNNRVYQFSTIGEDTPDLKYKGEATRLLIGDNNVIREGVTIHRGTVQDKSETVIGNHNLLMAYVHIGHDSIIGNHTILVNNTALAGHVIVEDWAILSGYTLVHQFCRIGCHSFSGMGTAIGKDVPAFVVVNGSPAEAKSINAEGLRRRGFSKQHIQLITKAYKLIYRQGLTVDEACVELEKLVPQCEYITSLIRSLRESTRGIVR
ncbi:MAG: acyl-ACP--UDP-N-acetylglucosamine O-acyltransferase [Pseudomonadales bacterium]|nr:acyl-ACP--UDP-N-acetylglucosamine O-acyltransferase [Pseudomonadales bacterium]